MPNIVSQTTNVNHETGEVRSTETHKKYRSEEPNYIKLYLKDLAYLHDLPQAASNLVHELLGYVTYNTQEIVLNSTVKKRIAGIMNVAMKTLNNNLQQLVKKGVLERVAPGTFRLNPYLFGKGDWKSIKALREQNIQLQIVYDKETNTRVIRGSIVEDEA